MKTKNGYDKLDFNRGEIPYLIGTRIRADDIYCIDYKTEGSTPKKIAKDRSLDLKDVTQAIEWCLMNDDLITRILARENKDLDKRLGV